MKRLLFLFLLLPGCTPLDVSPGTAAYESGNLGNGGFAFTCDDSVVCGPYYAAKKFPDAVALGSKFTVRYIPKAGTTSTVTLSGVGNGQLSVLGGGDFTAIGEGVATIVAKDSGGTLQEFVEIPIRRPDAIVISSTDSSAPLTKTTLEAYGFTGREFRASARYQTTELAGALTYEWTSSDKTVIQVQGNIEGHAVVTPMKTGTATLTATGGTFSQSIEVEVL